MLKVTPNQLHSTTSKQDKTTRLHNWCSYPRFAQEGCRVPLGTRDQLFRDFYSTMLPAYNWDPAASVSNAHHGGIFNMEFTPDGSLLVAACENKSILILDPLQGTLVKAINNAHNNCVNCIRFLDSRMFASCSDDNCISLWDIRFLKSQIRTLKGHSNWVKNIEYAHDEGLLVTSGFDGSIFSWDINRYSEGDAQFKCVFHTDGLMRTRLSPDGSKLVLCTSSGYLMVIHDLDLHSLDKDLRAFKPSIYYHMQQSNTPLHVGCIYNHLFTARRNRVELISDFPTGNDAEVISSLQVHPQGWCVLSRNTSTDENSEWTCLHDIQDIPGCSRLEEGEEEEEMGEVEDGKDEPSENDSDDDNDYDSEDETRGESEIVANDDSLDSGSSTSQIESRSESSQAESATGLSADGHRTRPVFHIRFNCRQRVASEVRIPEAEAAAATAAAAATTTTTTTTSSSNLSDSLGSVDVTFRISAFEDLETFAATLAAVRASQRNAAQDPREATSRMVGTSGSSLSAGATGAGRGEEDGSLNHAGGVDSSSSGGGDGDSGEEDEETEGSAADFRDRLAYLIRAGSHMSARRLVALRSNRRGARGRLPGGQNFFKRRASKIIHNHNRLTHFVAEPNVGRGFIKELCFSTDGRLVCSPFGHGVRLLAFNSNCSEMCDSVPDRPTRLYEVTSNICHPYVVVSTKFSPTHCLLVSGCLSGKICFYQPVLG